VETHDVDKVITAVSTSARFMEFPFFDSDTLRGLGHIGQ